MLLYKNDHAVVGLRSLCARIKGELKRIDGAAANLRLETERRLAELAESRAAWSAKLAAVESSARLLEPDFDVRTVQAIVSTPKTGHLPHGGLRKAILEELRLAGAWMTAGDIHSGVVKRYELVYESADAHRRHLQKTREALNALVNASPPRVERERQLRSGDFSMMQRWRLGAMFK